MLQSFCYIQLRTDFLYVYYLKLQINLANYIKEGMKYCDLVLLSVHVELMYDCYYYAKVN